MIFIYFSCTVRRYNIYRIEEIRKVESVPSSYRKVVETSANSSIDKIIIIKAHPELVEVTYDSIIIKNVRYEMDKFLFGLNSVLFCGGLIAAFSSEHDGEKRASLCFSLFGVGPVLLHDINKHGKSYQKKEHISTFKKIKPLYSAVGRDVHLIFTTSEGKHRIYLGQIGSDGALRIQAKRLMNNHKHKFRNQEEVLHYFSVGYIEIDWKKIQDEPHIKI
ncbi:MAG: hypothetical protein JXC36_09210 [Candidatus Atribacteria bacterium]|nr:hypothetical protein [Candidatus Atribacteria bacterium]